MRGLSYGPEELAAQPGPVGPLDGPQRTRAHGLPVTPGASGR